MNENNPSLTLIKFTILLSKPCGGYILDLVRRGSTPYLKDSFIGRNKNNTRNSKIEKWNNRPEAMLNFGA